MQAHSAWRITVLPAAEALSALPGTLAGGCYGQGALKGGVLSCAGLAAGGSESEDDFFLDPAGESAPWALLRVNAFADRLFRGKPIGPLPALAVSICRRGRC